MWGIVHSYKSKYLVWDVDSAVPVVAVAAISEMSVILEKKQKNNKFLIILVV